MPHTKVGILQIYLKTMFSLIFWIAPLMMLRLPENKTMKAVSELTVNFFDRSCKNIKCHKTRGQVWRFL